MRESPSRYGGIAAVLVIGIGLLATGRTWLGLGALVLGVLVMAIALSPSVSAKALFVTIGSVLLGGFLVYQAATNEITGSAIYHQPKPNSGRGWTSEAVAREGSPAKFRKATNYLWAGALFSLTVAIVAFSLARKLDYADDF